MVRCRTAGSSGSSICCAKSTSSALPSTWMPMSSKSVEDEPMYTRRLLPWTIALSFLLHGVAYASLGSAPATPKPTQRKTQLRFDVVQKAKPQPPEPTKPEPKPEPAKPKPQRAVEPK